MTPVSIIRRFPIWPPFTRTDRNQRAQLPHETRMCGPCVAAMAHLVDRITKPYIVLRMAHLESSSGIKGKSIITRILSNKWRA